MKKILVFLLIFGLLLTGCSISNSESNKFEIALITDAGNINDKSFNQSAWEATEKFATENGITSKFYKPANFDTAGYSDSIDEAVENGAKVIVTPGFKFSDTMQTKQTQYKDVKFIMIDAMPTGDVIEKNVYSALYAEEEPGYLAGYAVVKDGYTKLGFMGGMKLPAVIRYGYGFTQGAGDAAKEMNVKVEIKYNYTGSFNESPEIKTLSSAWYQDGTEVIFACGGSICNSVFLAAQEANAKSIGVDTDQKEASETVITSATKGVFNTVYNQLGKIYEVTPTFEGGKVETLTAQGGYVGLPDDFSKFKQFTKNDYEAILSKIQSGEVKIKGDAEVGADVTTLNNEFVTVIDISK